MPTDVATPNWRCDLCGNTHGEDRDLAERCESAPLPPLLPEGTPLLTAPNGKFELIPLTPTSKVDTEATQWNQAAGHHRTYTYPARGGSNATVSDKALTPAVPGYVQADNGPGRVHIDSRRTAEPRRLPRAALYEAFGLGDDNSLIRGTGTVGAESSFSWNSRATWVKPITPEVRAVIDLLGAHLPVERHRTDHGRVQGWENYLLGIAHGNLPRATAMLHTLPLARVDRNIEDLQRRWLDGEPIEAPWPWLETRSNLTASRITKAQRPLIEATGVPWLPRTNASEYLRTLLRETLMTTTPARTRSFGTTQIVAVGGVKGGVGKSTTAAALSYALAEAGHRTILVDLDLDGPTLHTIFNLEPGVPASKDLTGIAPQEVAPNLRVFSHAQIGANVLPVRWTSEEVTDWIRFLGETIDTTDTDIVVLDLPAGQGPVVNQVLAHNAPAAADVLVSVGSADPLTLQMHETRARIVVENLGRVIGRAADGSTVEVRPHGPATVVQDIAGKHRCTYGGSLPYAPAWRDLARSDEVKALAVLVAEPPKPDRG